MEQRVCALNYNFFLDHALNALKSGKGFTKEYDCIFHLDYIRESNQRGNKLPLVLKKKSYDLYCQLLSRLQLIRAEEERLKDY